MQRLLTRQCLESEGMRILEAKDGYEALELVANNAPDFVFYARIRSELSSGA
ncbi:MAG TPA: hypothetical protein DEX20_11445 [Halieaceae bacterium]|nr:hypothetical protein [Halieaceae bacterium]